LAASRSPRQGAPPKLLAVTDEVIIQDGRSRQACGLSGVLGAGNRQRDGSTIAFERRRRYGNQLPCSPSRVVFQAAVPFGQCFRNQCKGLGRAAPKVLLGASTPLARATDRADVMPLTAARRTVRCVLILSFPDRTGLLAHRSIRRPHGAPAGPGVNQTRVLILSSQRSCIMSGKRCAAAVCSV
jgi:hypothetical protein